MTKSENAKYQCGCGKIYSSYPAFSNHKKNKHGNHAQPGTTIPRPFNPKRGRPSFTLPQRQRDGQYLHYAALSCIEIGLLKLQQQHRGLLSDADDEANLDILNCFQEYRENTRNKATLRILDAIQKFMEVLLTHLSDKIAQVVVEYFSALTVFFLDRAPLEEEGMNWQQIDSGIRVDCSLFNLFLRQKGQQQRVRQLARRIEMPVDLLFNLTVLLSQYLSAVDLATSTLSLN